MEKTVSMGCMRRSGFLKVVQDVAEFIASGVPYLRGGSSCLTCTLVSAGCSCQNSPCSIARAAPGVQAAGAGSLAGPQCYDSVSSSHSGPLLEIGVRFTWGKWFVFFPVQIRSRGPRFGELQQGKQRNGSPSSWERGDPCQRAARRDLKGPQTLTIPSRSRRQMKICLTSFLYVMLNYLSVAFRAVCSYSMKGHPAHTRCLEG